MKRHKGIIKRRNELAAICGWCDSAEAINGSCLSRQERQQMQAKLMEIVSWIDGKLFN